MTKKLFVSLMLTACSACLWAGAPEEMAREAGAPFEGEQRNASVLPAGRSEEWVGGIAGPLTPSHSGARSLELGPAKKIKTEELGAMNPEVAKAGLFGLIPGAFIGAALGAAAWGYPILGALLGMVLGWAVAVLAYGGYLLIRNAVIGTGTYK